MRDKKEPPLISNAHNRCNKIASTRHQPNYGITVKFVFLVTPPPAAEMVTTNICYYRSRLHREVCGTNSCNYGHTRWNGCNRRVAARQDDPHSTRGTIWPCRDRADVSLGDKQLADAFIPTSMHSTSRPSIG